MLEIRAALSDRAGVLIQPLHGRWVWLWIERQMPSNPGTGFESIRLGPILGEARGAEAGGKAQLAMKNFDLRFASILESNAKVQRDEQREVPNTSLELSAVWLRKSRGLSARRSTLQDREPGTGEQREQPPGRHVSSEIRPKDPPLENGSRDDAADDEGSDGCDDPSRYEW